ncbi:hypothetical protein TSUD_142750 [Trifolium subterraneum]|uniref:Transposase MuDR plant domain-containing protein n=1 Tax=Trifolium subterraneum TaxID=3900 RepID=A0A2Z6PI31_TRISU|nr:hypothetical protein TSUD_142750 [Trifolium subterraneum]
MYRDSCKKQVATAGVSPLTMGGDVGVGLWTPFDQTHSSNHHDNYQQLPLLDLNSPPTELQSQPWSYSNTPLPQSQPYWSSNAQLPQSYPQPSQPSSSTYAPTNNERLDEVPNYAEEVSDHSGDEEENIELLFQSNDADDNVREAYNPPSFMRNLDDTVDDPTRVLLYETQRLPVDAGISAGMIFHTKADCLQAVKNYHINKSAQYKIEKSDKTRYIIKCEQPQCQFSMRASKSEQTQLWSIVNIKNSHTCTSSGLSQDHPRLDASLISQIIVPILKDNLSTSVKVIIAYIIEKFNHTISYRKAWNAKNKAIEKICGNWVDSFHDLPQWLMVMEQWNPGTIVRLETSPTCIQGQVFFDRVFWAFKPCIEGFAHCKPLVQVDGTWLNGNVAIAFSLYHTCSFCHHCSLVEKEKKSCKVNGYTGGVAIDIEVATLPVSPLRSPLCRGISAKIEGSQINTTRLKQEIYSLRQDHRSVSEFYSELKQLWEELELYLPIPQCTCRNRCTCEAMRSARNNHTLMHTIRFLTGLNDQFSIVKSQILLIDPLPQMNKVFSMVLQHERQNNLASLDDSKFLVHVARTGNDDSPAITSPSISQDQYDRLISLLQSSNLASNDQSASSNQVGSSMMTDLPSGSKDYEDDWFC